MAYVRNSEKSVDQAVTDLEASVQRHGFGVLHSYDFKETLRAKGFDLPHHCRVLEICDPARASEILHRDMSMNMLLPCRVSVYEDRGRTRIGMIPPTDILGLVSESEAIRREAQEVESTIKAMIDESV